jgi:hypothetical protein
VVPRGEIGVVTGAEGEYGDGDEIVEVLCSGELHGNKHGDAAIELLSRLNHGYPASNLSRLIRSDNEQAVKTGAWLVSELGVRASQIIDEVAFLLEHPVRNARYYAIEAVLVAATGENGDLLAKAVMLIADPDDAVRRMAMRLLARATPEQLAAAVPHLRDNKVADLTRWLLSGGSDPARVPEAIDKLGDPDRRVRMFAAAAAARVARRESHALEFAAQSSDKDIRTFAERELALPKGPQRPSNGC